MGMLSTLLLAPLTAPARGTLWLARKLAETAEGERNNPSHLRPALRAAEEQLLAGTLSEEEYDEIETDILTRLRGAGL